MKKVMAFLSLLSFLMSSCNASNNQKTDLEEPPTELKNNLLYDSYNLPKNEITFSWVMNDREDNEYQTAYCIGIGKTLEQAKQEEFIYSTGWVTSHNNTSVIIDDLGLHLYDDSLFYWVVATKDKNGTKSSYSEPKAFRTSVSWKSTRGIWASNNGTKSNDDFCFIGSKFMVDNVEMVDKVFLDITASSPEPSRQYVYQAFINDEFVGLGPSRIDKTANGQKILYYNSFDVTDYISNNNSLGLWLYTTQEKSALFQITAFYKDGSKEVLLNSGSDIDKCFSLEADDIFRKDNSIGTGYYISHANNIDANKYPFSFSSYDFDYSMWMPCVLCNDLTENYLLKPALYENIKRYKTDNAVVEKKNNSIFIDLNKEIIGGFSLEIKSDVEQDIELRFGEQLNEDGTVRYHMPTSNNYVETWRLKKGLQIIENHTMMAYRYVEIVGNLSKIQIIDAKGLSYHTPYNLNESCFSSDNDLLNKMYELSRYTIETTTQDIFVDSYSRERRAYEGDAFINQMMCYAAQSNYSTPRFTINYLLNNPTWPAEYYLLFSKMSYLDYLYTSDISFLKANYEIIKTKNFDDYYDSKFNLTSNGGLPETQLYSYLIDWPEEERDQYDTNTFFNTVFNCLHVSTYEELALIAELLNKQEDAIGYIEKASQMKAAIINKMFNNEVGAFCDGLYKNGDQSNHYSQHATAYALYCGIFDSTEMKNKMAGFLGNEIKMSVYGSYFLINGLYKNNNADRAFNLLTCSPTETNNRSWKYIIENLNATLCPEAWGEQNKNNLTLSHPWSGTPIVAITNGIFGIRPTSAAFDTFDIAIRPDGLTEASLVTPCIRGKIKISFNINTKIIDVSIPCNTKARIFIPHNLGSTVTCNGESVEVFKQQEYNYFVIQSGEKHISLM